MTISFYFETPVKLTQRRLLKQFIHKQLIQKEKALIDSLTIIFCSDPYLLDINNKFLGHNYYTDIITFDLKEDIEKASRGEIYISIDRIRENSLKYSTAFADELNRVIFHGILHLCGYKDKTHIEKMKMSTKEDYYLKQYKKYVPRETQS